MDFGLAWSSSIGTPGPGAPDSASLRTLFELQSSWNSLQA